MWLTILSFAVVLASFLLVGLSSNLRRRATTDDYLVASRQIHPWLVGFATASTNSSGFMFIGLIGVTVTDGLSSMWLMVGWIVGDYLAWLVIHRRLRERSGELGVRSVSGFVSAVSPALSSEESDTSSTRNQCAVAASGDRVRLESLTYVRVICALLIITFLGTYAAAQFTAGSKGLEALLGWPMWVGVLIGAGLLMMYCSTGGLRASIWVNTAQAFVMIGSVALLLVAALSRIGGLSELWSRLQSLDPKYVDWQPQNLKFGFVAYLLSWIAAGTGVVGQPHLMTIAMTIDSGESMYRARRVYFVWYWLFSAFCILVGLCCRVVLNDELTAGMDPEMALPRMAEELLPGVLVGVILAGLFAATLSTADTQILCCAAAVTHDLFPKLGQTYRGTKLGMLCMSAAVVLVALFGSRSVFELVVLSWSTLAASIGPILALQALRQPNNNRVGTTMILGGLTAALAWRYGLKLSSSMYEVLPGMLMGFAIYGAARLIGLVAPRMPRERPSVDLAREAESCAE